MSDRATDTRDPVRPGPEPDSSGTAPASAILSRVKSSDLFAGAREVVIEHEGDEYRLRHTSKGKLILTK